MHTQIQDGTPLLLLPLPPLLLQAVQLEALTLLLLLLLPLPLLQAVLQLAAREQWAVKEAALLAQIEALQEQVRQQQPAHEGAAEE